MKKKIPSEQAVINHIVLGSEDPAKTPPSPAKSTSSSEETKVPAITNEPQKKTSGLAMFIIGLFALVVGAVLLLKTLTDRPATLDAEYLVTIGTWERSDEPTVIWQFTEVGKGTLTTNDHANDYNFIWALDDGKLAIETDWLYTLNNSYNYKLDQSANVLTLYGDNNEVLYTFIPFNTDSLAPES